MFFKWFDSLCNYLIWNDYTPLWLMKKLGKRDLEILDTLEKEPFKK